MTGARLKANPIEIAVFALTTGLFGNTLYQLVHDSANYRPAALAMSNATPTTEGRAPASAIENLMTLEMPCENEKTALLTRTPKVRLGGSWCSGTDPESDRTPASVTAQTSPTKISVRNTTTGAHATAFNDPTRKAYMTEYLVLAPGDNTLEVELTYADGTVAELARKIKRAE